MSSDIVKFVCRSAELIHKMRTLQFNRFLQRFISGGCQAYMLLANLVLSIVLATKA